MKKKNKIIIFVAAGIVIIAFLTFQKLGSSDKTTVFAGGFGNRNSDVPVEAMIVKPVRLHNSVLTSGTIMANEEVELRSEVSGKITQILFKEGTNIKKSQLLVKINDAELKAQLERAKYILKLSEEKEYRQRNLLKKEAISQEEYDAALNELNVNKAQIDLIKAQIAKTEITAPFNGRIGLRHVSIGSYITPVTNIATLQEIDPIKIDFSVPEKYATLVETGNQINFNIVGSNKTYTGKIYAIEPKINNETRTLNIRAICSNQDGKLLPGGFADVTLILKDIDNALMVPSEAIVPILKGQKLYLYKNGKVAERVIDTGIRTDSTVQVTRGLAPNDTIITSGILQVRPGMPVTISKLN